MKQVLFPLIALACVLVSYAQAAAAVEGSNKNEIEGTPSYNLKRLLYILSEPRYSRDENMQLQHLEKLVFHIGDMEDSAERVLAERDLKDIIKKIKDFIKKIFNKDKKPMDKKPMDKKPTDKENDKKEAS